MVRSQTLLDPARIGRDASALETSLKRLIVGQDEAVRQIVNVYQTYLAGLTAPGRPVGSFLFLGPTGSGKTRIVEATAESLLGTPRALIKIDCGEFQHSHEIAKLIGSPPGYLGHRETHPLLSQETLNQHHTDAVKLSLVLFDELEKASDAVYHLLLGILDKATLTLGDNRRVDFSRSMIFMTSNVGASEISSILNPRFGFLRPDSAQRDNPENCTVRDAKITESSLEAARRKFPPEFINRPDKIVVFKPLGPAELRRVLGIELGLLQQRILEAASQNKFVFALTDSAKEHLLDQGTDVRYGARPLRRAIETLLVRPLASLVATEQVRRGDRLKVDFDPRLRQLAFIKEAEAVPVDDLVGLNSPMSRAAHGELVVGAIADRTRPADARSPSRRG